jgi:hypothetical protein
VVVVGGAGAVGSEFRGESLPRLGRDVRDRDGRTLARQGPHVRRAHASGGAGDQRDLAGNTS